MKKLLCTILMTALIVCMMPAMAFADTPAKTWDANGKFKVELKSGQTDAFAEVYDDYSVFAKVVGTTVDAASVTATATMKNVASLGVDGERTHSITLNTGISGKAEISLTQHFPNIFAFSGATVNGKVDGNSFTYTISAVNKAADQENSKDVYTCTATPTDVEEVRTAWHALAAKVTATTDADNSRIVIPAGTYLQIGNEKLIFDKQCTVDPSSQAGGAGTETAIRDAARLVTDALDAKANIEMYLPQGSVLQIGGSIATLNKSLYIRSDLTLADGQLASLRDADNIVVMIVNLVGMVNTAVGNVSGRTVNVAILSKCEVTVNNEKVPYAYGDTIVLPSDPQVPSGQRFVGWYNGDTKVEANSAVTSDMTLTARFETISSPGGIPSIPTAPTDNVTNSGTAGTDNATTSADLSGSTSTSNGTTSATVDKTTADKIVDKAVANKSEEIVIDATANSTTASNSTTTAQVTIPTDTLGAIAEKTEADVTIKTDVAEVKLDNASAAAVADQAEGDTVQIIAEKVKEDATEVHFELKVVCSDGKVISDFKGGNVAVTVALPKAMADKKVVCVYIDDNGHMSKVEGQKNADGTYTFNTGHFSSYVIMAEEEADAAIAAQKEAIKNIKIKLTSKQVKTKAGKKAVKITWTADAGDKVLDGVEVFRSTERYKGYGTEPFYTSTKGGNTGSYTNTKSLKKGTKYYYRVRGYVLVDGQKVYTDYSTKAWRTVK